MAYQTIDYSDFRAKKNNRREYRSFCEKKWTTIRSDMLTEFKQSLNEYVDQANLTDPKTFIRSKTAEFKTELLDCGRGIDKCESGCHFFDSCNRNRLKAFEQNKLNKQKEIDNAKAEVERIEALYPVLPSMRFYVEPNLIEVKEPEAKQSTPPPKPVFSSIYDLLDQEDDQADDESED